MACSIKEFGGIGRQRHLVVQVNYPYRYMLTTLCGHSASVPGIWRKNTTKPKCPQCAEIETS